MTFLFVYPLFLCYVLLKEFTRT